MKFNPEKYPYQVVRPILSSGPEYYSSAVPISQHLTADAAWGEIDAANKELKRQPGNKGSYVEWTVIDARTFEPCPRHSDLGEDS